METSSSHPYDPSPESIAKVMTGYRREYGIELTEEQAREVLGMAVRFTEIHVRERLRGIQERRAGGTVY